MIVFAEGSSLWFDDIHWNLIANATLPSFVAIHWSIPHAVICCFGWIRWWSGFSSKWSIVATDDQQCMNVSTPLSQSVSVMIMMIPFPSISEFFVNDKAVLFVLLTPSDIDNLCRCYVIMPRWPPIEFHDMNVICSFIRFVWRSSRWLEKHPASSSIEMWFLRISVCNELACFMRAVHRTVCFSVSPVLNSIGPLLPYQKSLVP